MSIGQSIRHPEWDERTSGAIGYTQDLVPANALVGRVLRCPHAHARIVRIDTRAAKGAPGVAAVLTGDDLPRRNYRDYGQEDRPALARTTARYFGHEVAVAAAETAEQADQALSLVRVDYKVLPAATTVAAALKPGAPAVHPQRAPDNVATAAERQFGDMAAARRRTAHTQQGDYDCGIQAHACMEPHSAVAAWDEATATLNVWTPTQSPRNVLAEIAHVLELAPDKVRLHRVAVGGDFGSRVKASDIEVLAGALSMAARRPVSIALSRAEEFAFTKRQHACTIRLETGVDADGLLTYQDGDVSVENGAFIHGGSNMMNYCSILLGSHYRLLGAEVRGRSVYTNRRPGGAFRGAGGPQATFAVESQMDEMADALGIDPIELRLRNITKPGERTITGWEIDSTAAAACLEAVRERLDWDTSRRHGGTGRGVGVALAIHVSGAIVTPATARAEAAVEIGHNGGVVLFSGCADPGTGELTVIAQLCAAELGLEPEAIDVRIMDTAVTPYDPGAGSSRATMITGGAVLTASRAIAGELKTLAAAKLGVDVADVVLHSGYALADGRRLALGELAAAHAASEGGTLRVHREQMAEIPVVPMTHTDSGVGNLSPAYAFAAHGVELEVDAGTGAVRVLRVVAAHDAGTVINPVGARSQVIGGVVMGLGAALGEQLLYDDGRPLVSGYTDYAMPRASDAPPVDVVFVGEAAPRGPHGAKSISEIAMMPTAAAVANALAHATGVRLRRLPMSPDKVIEALHAPGANTRPRSVLARPSRWWPAAVRRAYPLGLHALLHRWGPTRTVQSQPAVAIQSVMRPKTSDEAVQALASAAGARPAGGASDLLVLRDEGLAAPQTIVSLMRCHDLSGAWEDNGDLFIGGAMTLAEAAAALARLGRPGDKAIAETIATIATPQIREMGTVVGNLCQAKRCWFYRSGFDCYKRGGFGRPCYAVLGDNRYYHAALGAQRCQAVTPSDLATTLTALDAVVTAKSACGTRRIALADFYCGPGETVLTDDEIVQSIRIPAAARSRSTRFNKLALTDDGFAVVSACVSMERPSEGAAAACRIVLGGIANRPYRALRSEERLKPGRHAPPDLAEAAGAWVAEAHPLAGNAWKLKAGTAVLRRTLETVVHG